MPITPLHFGVLAPINHWFPKKVSNVSFILVNLWLDGNAILYYGFNLPYEQDLHDTMTHSLVAAWIMAGVLAVLGYKSRKWLLGAFLGATSHVLLDMVVHSEMLPFYPVEGNPFYLGWMEPLSLALVPLTIWLIVQYVSGILGWVRTNQNKTLKE